MELIQFLNITVFIFSVVAIVIYVLALVFSGPEAI